MKPQNKQPRPEAETNPSSAPRPREPELAIQKQWSKVARDTTFALADGEIGRAHV